MPTLMLIGATLLFAGASALMVLLFAHGGLQKLRQFVVLGEILSEKLGSQRRAIGALSLALLGVGAVCCYAGVARMDALRATCCQNFCVVSRYAQGKIGPSIDRTPASRFVACACTSKGLPTLEQRADALPR